MTDIENIKAKVKDLIRQNELYESENATDAVRYQKTGAYSVLNEVLYFIDSLQEEPVSEELEKAAKDFSNNLDNIYGSIGEQTRKSFKAGAKWQKDRMMLNTIDATCFGFQGAALFTFRLPAGAYLVGSKVKVIVIKED